MMMPDLFSGCRVLGVLVLSVCVLLAPFVYLAEKDNELDNQLNKRFRH